jgi:hypothetical protein
LLHSGNMDAVRRRAALGGIAALFIVAAAISSIKSIHVAGMPDDPRFPCGSLIAPQRYPVAPFVGGGAVTGRAVCHDARVHRAYWVVGAAATGVIFLAAARPRRDNCRPDVDPAACSTAGSRIA